MNNRRRMLIVPKVCMGAFIIGRLGMTAHLPDPEAAKTSRPRPLSISSSLLWRANNDKIWEEEDTGILMTSATSTTKSMLQSESRAQGSSLMHLQHTLDDILAP